MTVRDSAASGRYQTTLFDLDGTLTDPATGITRSIQFALRKRGIAPPEAAALEVFIGPPLAESFREHFGLGEAEAKQAVEDYREYFSARGIFENRVYAGVPELLARLRAEGRRVALATSKPTVYARRILEHFDLGACFRSVVGSFLDGRRVEKAELVAEALARSRGAGACVMVGDREHDVLGARANGIDSIGVLYGFGTESELTRARPTRSAPSVDALSELLLGA